jgi:hypothetical protein
VIVRASPRARPKEDCEEELRSKTISEAVLPEAVMKDELLPRKYCAKSDPDPFTVEPEPVVGVSLLLQAEIRRSPPRRSGRVKRERVECAIAGKGTGYFIRRQVGNYGNYSLPNSKLAIRNKFKTWKFCK